MMGGGNIMFFHIGSYDSTVRVWDCKARTFDPVQVLREAKDSITSLQLTSSEILTGSVVGVVWNVCKWMLG